MNKLKLFLISVMLSIFMCFPAYALSDVSKTLPAQAGDYTDTIDGLDAATMKGTRLYNFTGTDSTSTVTVTFKNSVGSGWFVVFNEHRDVIVYKQVSNNTTPLRFKLGYFVGENEVQVKYLPGRYTESGVKNLIYKDQIWGRCTSNAATFKINNYKKPPYGAKCVRKGDRWCASFVGNLPRTVTTSEGGTAHTRLNLAFLINDAKLMFHDPIQLNTAHPSPTTKRDLYGLNSEVPTNYIHLRKEYAGVPAHKNAAVYFANGHLITTLNPLLKENAIDCLVRYDTDNHWPPTIGPSGYNDFESCKPSSTLATSGGFYIVDRGYRANADTKFFHSKFEWHDNGDYYVYVELLDQRFEKDPPTSFGLWGTYEWQTERNGYRTEMLPSFQQVCINHKGILQHDASSHWWHCGTCGQNYSKSPHSSSTWRYDANNQLAHETYLL